MKKSTKWISAYLFYPHSSNEVLKQFISAYIRSLKRCGRLYRYFFIRYNESGPHLRLRLKVDGSQEDGVRKELEHEWMQFISSNYQNADDFNALLFESNNTIKFVDYKAEFQRYGGERNISTAELQFEASSKLVLRLISALRDQWNTQTELVLTLKLNIVFLLSLDLSLEKMLNICHIFIQEWLPSLYDPAKPRDDEQLFFLSCFKEKYAMQRNKLLPAVSRFFNDFRHGMIRDRGLINYQNLNKEVKRRYDKQHCDLAERPDIITSFMHMTHNRIGISNADEAYIVYLLYQCLNDFTTNEP